MCMWLLVYVVDSENNTDLGITNISINISHKHIYKQIIEYILINLRKLFY